MARHEGTTHLLHFPLIALVGSGHIVRQRLRAGEVMVAAGGGDNVALACDLAGESGHGAGDLVNLAEKEDAGEAAGREKGGRESASGASLLCGHENEVGRNGGSHAFGY